MENMPTLASRPALAPAPSPPAKIRVVFEDEPRPRYGSLSQTMQSISAPLSSISRTKVMRSSSEYERAPLTGAKKKGTTPQRKHSSSTGRSIPGQSNSTIMSDLVLWTSLKLMRI